MTLGERLASVGLAEDAVAAFLRGQDVKAAIDCCVLLNQVLSAYFALLVQKYKY